MTAPKARFAHFTCSEMLGAGGMGEVWKAWDGRLGRWVALKLVKGNDEEEVARFLREARTAASLNHPNIAAVFEAGREQGRAYIAMQLVDGETLKTFPRADRRELVRILRDAALALQHAHERGVVHRDLKPENLMVSGGHVYVMDFGLAKQLAMDHSSGVVAGTPSYMSPEQARGERADARSDVYGLGATLYELLADRRPFEGRNVPDLLRKVAEEEPKAPRRIDGSIPADLETVALKCLEKDPARRYRSARELAEDLGRWLEGEPVAAKASSAAYRLRKWLGKHRGMAAVGAGATLLLVLALAILLPRLSAESARRAEAERRREEESVFATVEKELDLLRMNRYRKDYRLTELEFGKFSGQVRRVEERMRTGGPSARGCTLVGRLREESGDPRGAEAEYARAMQLDPGYAPALVARGRLRVESALYSWTGSAADPRSRREAREEAREAVAWIRRGVAGAGAEGRLEAEIAAAYLDAIEGRRVDSQAALERWKGRPYAEEFLIPEGVASSASRLHQLSADLVDRVPSWPEAYFWRAVARQQLGDPAGARADLDRALLIHPRHPMALFGRGTLRLKTGDPAGAREDLDALLAVQPDSAWGLTNRGHAQLISGDLAAAQRDVDRLFKLQPRAAVAWILQGLVRRDGGDLAGGVEAFTRAIQLDEGRADSWYHRGELRLETRDFEGALADFERALELDPRHVVAMVRVGNVHLALQDPARALAAYEQALGTDPRCAEAWYHRGNVWKGRGDLDRAMADYEKAIELHPRYAEALYNRGWVRSTRGDYEGARADCEAAVKAGGPLWVHRSQALSAIEELKKLLR